MSKLILSILTGFIICFVLNNETFMVPDQTREKVICTPLEGGYEYDNMVVDKEGITQLSPNADCWIMCTFNRCELVLNQPMTESWSARIIIGGLLGILMFVIFEI